MIYTDVVSGFLGAGKTTWIKKMLSELYKGEKVVIIENEFGQIGVDAGFLKETGIEIREMSNGCICCSLVGDFEKSLKEVRDTLKPDRIIIEPSGVGKLSDVLAAIKNVEDDELEIGKVITVVDAKKCKLYYKNFGEFFNNQIEFAKLVVLSRVDDISDDKLKECLELLHGINSEAGLITTNWDSLSKKQIDQAHENSLVRMEHLVSEASFLHESEHHHDHEHCHDHEHDHNHEHCHDHEHEHNHEHCHDHHHEHDHIQEGDYCTVHHHHEGHHHADEVFDSIGIETKLILTRDKLENILKALINDKKCGNILRAKGIVESNDSKWLHFDMVPEEYEIREGEADFTSRICVIGTNLDKKEIERELGLE